MNLAEQLKKELTARAKENYAKTSLLEWVMTRFRNGENPVLISCKNMIYMCSNKSWIESLGISPQKYGRITIDLKYEDGKHYGKPSIFLGKDWVDISDTAMANRYAVDGKDESDKKLFLESEGFRVEKTFIRGEGKVLVVSY